jgi:hypothetical protein
MKKGCLVFQAALLQMIGRTVGAAHNRKEAYFFSVAIASSFDIMASFFAIASSFDIMASFEAIASFDDIIASFDAIAPSVAVMLSVAMASVFMASVAIASLVVVSVLAQADTSSAALAIIEPVTTLEMSARI